MQNNSINIKPLNKNHVTRKYLQWFDDKEIKNIEQVRLQYNMFLLVTRDEDGLTQLYHGVIELYADPSEPQLNVLIPDGI